MHEKPSASEAKIISGRSAPFGFHQALVRLRLGLIMESDSTLLGREMVAFKETMPSQLSEGDDGNLLEKISLTMELFEAAGKSLQARPDDLEWAVEVLEKLVNDLLVVPESMPAEERIRSMVQSRLQDIRSLAKHGFGVEKVEISTLLVLSFYLEEHLGSTPSSTPNILPKWRSSRSISGGA